MLNGCYQVIVYINKHLLSAKPFILLGVAIDRIGGDERV
jgi:hypothetical protein